VVTGRETNIRLSCALPTVAVVLALVVLVAKILGAPISWWLVAAALMLPGVLTLLAFALAMIVVALIALIGDTSRR